MAGTTHNDIPAGQTSIGRVLASYGVYLVVLWTVVAAVMLLVADSLADDVARIAIFPLVAASHPAYRIGQIRLPWRVGLAALSAIATLTLCATLLVFRGTYNHAPHLGLADVLFVIAFTLFSTALAAWPATRIWPHVPTFHSG